MIQTRFFSRFRLWKGLVLVVFLFSCQKEQEVKPLVWNISSLQDLTIPTHIPDTLGFELATDLPNTEGYLEIGLLDSLGQPQGEGANYSVPAGQRSQKVSIALFSPAIRSGAYTLSFKLTQGSVVAYKKLPLKLVEIPFQTKGIWLLGTNMQQGVLSCLNPDLSFSSSVVLPWQASQMALSNHAQKMVVGGINKASLISCAETSKQISLNIGPDTCRVNFLTFHRNQIVMLTSNQMLKSFDALGVLQYDKQLDHQYRAMLLSASSKRLYMAQHALADNQYFLKVLELTTGKDQQGCKLPFKPIFLFAEDDMRAWVVGLTPNNETWLYQYVFSDNAVVPLVKWANEAVTVCNYAQSGMFFYYVPNQGVSRYTYMPQGILPVLSLTDVLALSFNRQRNTLLVAQTNALLEINVNTGTVIQQVSVASPAKELQLWYNREP